MIFYLSVGFWMYLYGFTPNEDFRMCMCLISVIETIGEIVIIIENWTKVKYSIKYSIANLCKSKSKSEESKDDRD